MVNAVGKHTATSVLLQEADPLMARLPDGGLYIAPEAIALFAPVLSQAAKIPAKIDKHSDETEAHDNSNVEHSSLHQNEMYVDAISQSSHYEENKKAFLRQGRAWSSMKRRAMRVHGLRAYEAFQTVANMAGEPVVQVKRLVEFANQKSKSRLTKMRRNLVWKYFLQELSHREIAKQFPFKVHYKTIENDIKEMKATLSRGGANA